MNASIIHTLHRFSRYLPLFFPSISFSSFFLAYSVFIVVIIIIIIIIVIIIITAIVVYYLVLFYLYGSHCRRASYKCAKRVRKLYDSCVLCTPWLAGKRPGRVIILCDHTHPAGSLHHWGLQIFFPGTSANYTLLNERTIMEAYVRTAHKSYVVAKLVKSQSPIEFLNHILSTFLLNNNVNRSINCTFSSNTIRIPQKNNLNCS